MKRCLNCQTEYEPKRETSLYCSVNCRVAYNRKNPKNKISPIQVQVLYNAMLGMVETSKQAQYDGPKLPDNFKGDELPLQITKVVPKAAKDAIMRKYVEDRRDFTCEEEYIGWMNRLESDDRLSKEDKQLVKNTH